MLTTMFYQVTPPPETIIMWDRTYRELLDLGVAEYHIRQKLWQPLDVELTVSESGEVLIINAENPTDISLTPYVYFVE